MGIDRIKRNLKSDTADVIGFCKNLIKDPSCMINRKGKNWYCRTNNIILTVNAHSYTIITAHIIS